jgi:catechol-2,3-dioxygenase
MGLTVSTHTELEQWIQKLKTLNVTYQLIDHERIYFSDPDGLVLELEVDEPVARNPRAAEVLVRWGQR